MYVHESPSLNHLSLSLSISVAGQSDVANPLILSNPVTSPLIWFLLSSCSLLLSVLLFALLYVLYSGGPSKLSSNSVVPSAFTTRRPLSYLGFLTFKFKNT